MAFGGAYAIRPYLLFFHQGKKRRQKKIKASTEAGEVRRIRVGDRKRTVFLGNTVGAYRIRPTNVPFMERITLKMDAFGAFAILRDGVWRAYAIRPYRGTSKRPKGLPFQPK